MSNFPNHSFCHWRRHFLPPSSQHDVIIIPDAVKVTGALFLLECGPSNDYMVFCTAKNFTRLCFTGVIMHGQHILMLAHHSFLSSLIYTHLTTISLCHCLIRTLQSSRRPRLAHGHWILHSGEQRWERSPECCRRQLSKIHSGCQFHAHVGKFIITGKLKSCAVRPKCFIQIRIFEILSVPVPRQ